MAFLRTEQPPHSGAEIECRVLDRPTQLAALRAALRGAVDGTPGAAAGTVAEDIVLVATELTSNAFQHGRPPAIVRLGRSETHLVLDVADHDPSTEPDFAAHRPAGAGGLGLRMALRVATDLGWYRTETTKHVWARFALPGRPA